MQKVKNNLSKEQKKSKLILTSKKIVMMMCCVLSVLCFTYKTINYELDKLDHDTSSTFPITHWIMMGLHGDGQYNSSDERITESFETKQEKISANIEEIKKTLKEYGVFTTIKHYLEKIPLIWSDGTVSYTKRIEDNYSPNSLYNWIVASKSDFIKVYAQCFRIVTVLFAIIYLVDKIRMKKTKIDKMFPIVLTLFGAILFYILWEVKSVYSIPFIPILLLLSCMGMDDVTGNSILFKINYKVLGITIILVTLTLAICFYPSFVNLKNTYRDYSLIVSNKSVTTSVGEVAVDNITFKQTFYPKKKFDTILLYANKTIDNADTEYTIEVRKNGKLIKERKITTETVNFENYITLELAEQNPDGDEYSVTVYCSDNCDEDTITWYHIEGRVYDYYDGILTINDEEIYGDLYIKVYREYEGSYMSKKTYVLLTLMLVLIEISLFYGLKKYT